MRATKNDIIFFFSVNDAFYKELLRKKGKKIKQLTVFLIYTSQIVVIEPYFYVLKAAGSLLLARRFFLLSTLRSI